MTVTAARRSRQETVLRVVSVPLMFLAGGLLAAQSQINGRLATHLGSGPRAGTAAALISLTTGLLILLPVSTVVPAHRRRLIALTQAVRERRLRPWEVSGPLLGAFLVASQGLTVATIGVALFNVAMTAGQACSALVVDRAGLGPAGRQPVSRSRATAAALAVAAVLLGAGERLATSFSWLFVLVAVIPFLSGAGAAVQQALNGRVARVVAPWATTVNNFVIGWIALLGALAASLLVRGRLHPLPHEAYLYAGGVLGVGFVALTSWLTRLHGVLVLSLSVIAGQVLTAEAIEAVLAHGHITAAGLTSAALTLLGVLVALGLQANH